MNKQFFSKKFIKSIFTVSFALILLLQSTFGAVPVYAIQTDLPDVEQGYDFKDMVVSNPELMNQIPFDYQDVPLGEENENPLGGDKIGLGIKSELVITDNNTDTVQYFDYDFSYQDYDPNASILDIASRKGNLSSTLYDASASVSFDKYGTGRNNYIARVSEYGKNNKKFFLEIVDGSSGKQLQSEQISELDYDISSNVSYEELESLVQITSGDFNGDGKDEIAVFAPNLERNFYDSSTVQIYKLKNDKMVKIKEFQVDDILPSDLENVYNSGMGNRASLPVVHLTAGELNYDQKEELIATVSFRNASLRTIDEMNAVTYILNLEDDKNIEIMGSFDHIWEIGDSTMVGAFGSAAIGDVDADTYAELVLSSFKFEESDLSSKDRSVIKDTALVSVVSYNFETQQYECSNSHNVKTNSVIAEGKDGSDLSPISLVCFNPYGTNEIGDYIFIEGNVYKIENGEWGSVLSDISAIYGLDEYSYFGDKQRKTDEIAITDIVVGDFMNHETNGDQLFFVVSRQSTAAMNYCRHDIVSIMDDGKGGLKNDYQCYNNNKSLWYYQNLDLTAADIDIDSSTLQYKEKYAYYTDPYVLTVLQASPYFDELTPLSASYAGGGSTQYGQLSGSDTTTNLGINVRLAQTYGYDAEVNFFGLFKTGGKGSVDFHASYGYDYISKTATTYSVRYTSNSLMDRVVLATAPTIKYIYDMDVPESTLPSREKYNQITDEYYKMQIDTMLDKGYSFGEKVPAQTVEFSIDIPQDLCTTIMSVDRYDQLAKENGMDCIKGNILNNEIGDPSTYPLTEAGMDEYQGGINTNDSQIQQNSQGFISVGLDGASISQGIDTTSATGSKKAWTAGVGASFVTKVFGGMAGPAITADHTGMIVATDYSTTSVSGTVAGLPTGSDGYGFKWKFGQWQDKLDGNTCLILGYLVKDITQTQKPLANFRVIDSTTNSITLGWDNNQPTVTNNGFPVSYEIYMYDDNHDKFLLGVVDGTENQFVVDQLSSNKAYEFVSRAITSVEYGVFSKTLQARTIAEGIEGVFELETTQDCYTIPGATAVFQAKTKYLQSNPNYQWQRKDIKDESSVWENLDGEKSAELRVTNVSKDDEKYQYRCEVSALVNGAIPVLITNPASLIVDKAKTETAITIGSDYGKSAVVKQTTELMDYTENVSVTKTIDGVIYNAANITYTSNAITSTGLALLKHEKNKSTELYFTTASDIEDVSASNIYLCEHLVGYSYLDAQFNEVDTTFTSSDTKSELVGGITINETVYPYVKQINSQNGDMFFIYATQEDMNNDIESQVLFSKDKVTFFDVVANEIGYTNTKDGDILTDVIITEQFIETTKTKQVEKVILEQGTPLELQATVKSKTDGLVNQPTGTVTFDIQFQNETIPSEKVVANLITSGSSSFSGSVCQATWTPKRDGMYTITAYYNGDTLRMASVSEPQIYKGYYIKDASGTQINQYLQFTDKNHIIYGEQLDLEPALKTVTLTVDDQLEITNEQSSVKNVTSIAAYSVNLNESSAIEGVDYTMQGSIFTPKTTGIFDILITINENGKDIISQKRVTVDKKSLYVLVNDSSVYFKDVTQSQFDLEFNNDNITFYEDLYVTKYNISESEYSYDGISFFKLETKANMDSSIGNYDILIVENDIKDDDWQASKQSFFAKYNVEFLNSTLSINCLSYPVTYSIGGVEGSENTGTITATMRNYQVPQMSKVNEEETIIFKAETKPGFSISHWTVNDQRVNSTNDSLEIKVEEKNIENNQLDVKVYFKVRIFNVKFDVVGENGTLTLTKDGQTLHNDTSILYADKLTFSAKPDDGYEVLRWYVNGEVITEQDDDTEFYHADTLDISVEGSLDVMVEYCKQGNRYNNVQLRVVDRYGSPEADVIGTIYSDMPAKNDQYLTHSNITIKIENPYEDLEVSEWRLYDGDSYTVLPIGNATEYTFVKQEQDYDIRVVMQNTAHCQLNVSYQLASDAPQIDVSTIGRLQTQVNGELIESNSGSFIQGSSVLVEFLQYDQSVSIVGWMVNGQFKPVYGLNRYSFNIQRDLDITIILSTNHMTSSPTEFDQQIKSMMDIDFTKYTDESVKLLNDFVFNTDYDTIKGDSQLEEEFIQKLSEMIDNLELKAETDPDFCDYFNNIIKLISQIYRIILLIVLILKTSIHFHLF